MVRAISTGVRLSTSVSSMIRETPCATPVTRPTKPCSLSTGLPSITPCAEPASAMRVLAKGPRASSTVWADTIGMGGSVLTPSRADKRAFSSRSLMTSSRHDRAVARSRRS